MKRERGSMRQDGSQKGGKGGKNETRWDKKETRLKQDLDKKRTNKKQNGGNNVSELNTGSGKVKCCERNTKKGLNKHNIRDNLSTILNDDLLIEIA